MQLTNITVDKYKIFVQSLLSCVIQKFFNQANGLLFLLYLAILFTFFVITSFCVLIYVLRLEMTINTINRIEKI